MASASSDAKKDSNSRASEAAQVYVNKLLSTCALPGKSRILITSRLYPADLTAGRRFLPGCDGRALRGLTDSDAFDLWTEMGARGSRRLVSEYLRSFRNHALLVKVLAGTVSESASDFDDWLRRNEDFKFVKDLKQTKQQHHVLFYALRDLTATERRMLEVVTTFKSPIDFGAARELLVKPAGQQSDAARPYASEAGMRNDAKHLKDRGLLGWDGDLGPDKNLEVHPVIRAYVWGESAAKTSLLELVAEYSKLRLDKLGQLPTGLRETKAEENRRWAVERLFALINLHRWKDALGLLGVRLPGQDLGFAESLYFFGKGWVLQNALNTLLASPQDESSEATSSTPPEWLRENPAEHALFLREVGKAMMWGGDTRDAAAVFESAVEILEAIPTGQPFEPLKYQFVQIDVTLTTPDEVAILPLSELIHAHRLSGHLRMAEWAARRALALSRAIEEAEHVNLFRLGMVLSIRGKTCAAEVVYRQSLEYWEAHNVEHLRGFLNACLAQQALWMGDVERAGELAEHFWWWFCAQQRPNNTMTGHRLLGTIALERRESALDLEEADKHLKKALTLARESERVEEELLALVPLAKLRWHQGKKEEARDLLERVKNLGFEKFYPCFYADRLNVLASIERDARNEAAAIDAATEAYKLAWCDGPPFAYHWGLETAKQHFIQLGVTTLPEMPLYDDSRFPSMPGVWSLPQHTELP